MNLTRRGFIGGLFAAAAVRTWPFRVFSFPTEVVTTKLVLPERFVTRFDVLYGWSEIYPPALKHMAATIEELLPRVYDRPQLIGSRVPIRVPQLKSAES